MRPIPVRCAKFVALSLLLVAMAPAAVLKNKTGSRFVRALVGPAAVAGAAIGAGFGQAINKPAQWGQGAAGFGKRFASAMGKNAVDKSISFAVADIRHEELSYRPSGKTGFGPRLGYALESTVITHKTDTGKPTVATNEFAGAFGSGLISRLWQPAALRTLSGGLASGGITMGVDAGTHVLREFWPDITHPHRTHLIGPHTYAISRN